MDEAARKERLKRIFPQGLYYVEKCKKPEGETHYRTHIVARNTTDEIFNVFLQDLELKLNKGQYIGIALKLEDFNVRECSVEHDMKALRRFEVLSLTIVPEGQKYETKGDAFCFSTMD